jgi:regulatory protein
MNLARPRRAPPAEPLADPEACREAALKLLERMRRTRAELAKRLRAKGHEGAVVEGVLDRLAAVGLVDDIEYARAFLVERWGRRAAGWTRLRLELRKRGVRDDDIAAARERFEAESGGADEAATARRVAEQAAGRMRGLEPRVRQRRLYGLLARRGFAPDTIRQALQLAGDDTDPETDPTPR